MNNKITCFIPATDTASLFATVRSLRETGVVAKVYIISENQALRESPVPEAA